MKYVYGIVWKGADLGDDLEGHQEQPICSVAHDEIAAVVSDFSDSRLPMNEDGVLLHSAVVEEVFRHATIIPFRFGTLLKDEGSVSDLLQAQGEQFCSALKKLDQQVEFGLKVRLDAAPSEKARATNGTGSEYIMKRFERYAQIKEITDAISRSLDPLFTDVKSDGASANGTVNLYYLVPSEKRVEFEAAVEGVDFGGPYLLTGPWPPYNFVENVVSE